MRYSLGSRLFWVGFCIMAAAFLLSWVAYESGSRLLRIISFGIALLGGGIGTVGWVVSAIQTLKEEFRRKR